MTQSAAPFHYPGRLPRLTAALTLAWASLTLASLPLPAFAQEAATAPARPALTAPVSLLSPDWQTLNSDQKRLLEPLADEWNSLESANRVRWLELTARYHTMSADEQRLLEERIASWARLSPTERQQARQSFQQARQIKPKDREAKWEAYQALPAEQREALAGKAAQKRQPAPAGAKPAAAAASAAARQPGASLKPLPPAVLTSQASGTALLQAKPGASTVLINQRPAAAPSKIRRRFFDAEHLDARTLLPRALPASAADGKS